MWRRFWQWLRHGPTYRLPPCQHCGEIARNMTWHMGVADDYSDYFHSWCCSRCGITNRLTRAEYFAFKNRQESEMFFLPWHMRWSEFIGKE